MSERLSRVAREHLEEAALQMSLVWVRVGHHLDEQERASLEGAIKRVEIVLGYNRTPHEALAAGLRALPAQPVPDSEEEPNG